MKFSVEGFKHFLKGIFSVEEGHRVEPKDRGDDDFANERLSYNSQSQSISDYRMFILGCESQARDDADALHKAYKQLQDVKAAIEQYRIDKQRELYEGLMRVSVHWFNKLISVECFPDLMFKVGMYKKVDLEKERDSATGNTRYGIDMQISLAQAFFRVITDTYDNKKGGKEELMRDVNQLLGCYRNAKTSSNSDIVSSFSILLDSIARNDVEKAKEDLETLMKDNINIESRDVVRRVNKPEMGMEF